MLVGVGLVSGFVIYLVAKPVELDPLMGDLLQNKRYVHELQVMGGKSNLLMARFMAWFGDRWRGPQLGITIGVLTVLATLAFRWGAARPDLWRDPEPEPVPVPKAKN